MADCPKCATAAPEGAAFCSRCGSQVAAASGSAVSDETRILPRDDITQTSFAGSSATPAKPASTSVPGSGPAADADHGWFLPGAILAGRYRIVGRLGAGGMGEVYRADDLRLGQTVALKFLPPDFANDPKRVEIFHNEVRLARQVTHPNVCRVHDIGEVDGFLFLSMEYVDGEDLASLLRRIGRVPQDKALELTRQICAGLAAAHEKGVLHRDLKPGNIMVDGRGRARITDFGLAAVAGSIAGVDIRSGTPVYMAPEQLAGHEVTIRSDVYSLGLVLYELFTGKRPFHGATLAELQRQQSAEDLASPTTVVPNLDPVVESVILRCLAPEPEQRPASALAVAAALPGGDPLAAALAAGETPSPELVAAAGAAGALRPRAAWAIFALLVVLVALLVATAPRAILVNAVGPEKPPEVLAERARDLLAAAGNGAAADRAHSFAADATYLRWLESDGKLASDWSKLPARWYRGLRFWYREAEAPFDPYNVYGDILPGDPPLVAPGQRLVVLTDRGHLMSLIANPPPVVDEEGDASAESTPVDWRPLLQATGLDVAALAPASPKWTPPPFADARAAWTGPAPDDSGVELRVEAAAFRGKPVYFEVVGPWVRRSPKGPEPATASQRAAQVINLMIVMGALASACVMAWRNVKAGRGDRRGALRLAFGVFAALTVAALVSTHPPDSIQAAWDRFSGAAAIACFLGLMIYVIYLALEPVVRRSHPTAIIAWTRLLAGRWRDPLVGRDLLTGLSFGAAIATLERLFFLLPDWFGLPAPGPAAVSLGPLEGVLGSLASLVGMGLSAVISSMLMMFMMSIGYRFGRPRIGHAIFFGFTFLMASLTAPRSHLAIVLPVAGAFAVLFTVLFGRHGLVAGMAAMLLVQWNLPYPAALDAWYAGSTAMLLAIVVAPAVLGLRSVLAGRS